MGGDLTALTDERKRGKVKERGVLDDGDGEYKERKRQVTERKRQYNDLVVSTVASQ